VGHAQECHAECRYISWVQTIDMLDSVDLRSLAMEMEVGDDRAAGPSRLGYYKHQRASPTANVTRATRASLAPAYDARIVCALARGKDAHAYS